MKFTTALAAIGMAITVSIAPGQAEVTAKQAIDIFDGGEEIDKAYLRGMGEGIGWANTATTVAGNPALYCPPQKVEIVGEQYAAILKDYMVRYPNLRSAPFGAVLLAALQQAFPCK